MTFDFNTAGAEAILLEQLGYDPREYAFTTTASTTGPIPSLIPTAMPQSNRQSPGLNWPMGFDMSGGLGGMSTAQSPNAASVTASSSDDSQAPSPSHHSAGLHSSAASSPHQQQLSPYQAVSQPHAHAASLLADWTLQQQQQQHHHHHQHQHQHQHQQHHNQASQELQFLSESAMVPFHTFPGLQPSPLDYLPATTTAALEASLQMESAFNTTMSPVDESAHAMQWNLGLATNWVDAAMHFPTDGLPRLGSLGSNSPTGTYLEVQSLGSGSESGWNTVDAYPTFDAYQQAHHAQNAAIFNPSQTLHLRTHSDSTHSDGCNSLDIGSYEEVTFPYSPFSPESDSHNDQAGAHGHRHCFGESHSHKQSSPDNVSPTAVVPPVTIKAAASTSRVTPASGSGVGSSSSVSPPARRLSGPRKSPIAKTTKSVTRRSPPGKDIKPPGEKKVGRRRGPLLPEQRKQASEIRKLRACLRCKFLKKTCDKGEPCAGCQPSHARLWQVPCTRIDIKDINYFMKDWKADTERHMSRGVSVYNVKGFAQKESLMWITHGYGFCLPVMVREVFVSDASCFQVNWVESYLADQEPIDFEVRTEGLDVGRDGISMEALNEYLDKHIDGFYETFIDDHFEGTKFVTEILRTAYRFYMKEKSPTIRKALKLVLAYNLTTHITMVEMQGEENIGEGQIDDEDSKYFGKVVAPVMINFQIKCALADMWRELQKDTLEELSALYSSVYSGDRLKNWPTIFMLASILLVVWEEMQFDCHYRVPDPVAVNKFCHDMESTPVGVIAGLFHAISQKLPAFTEWDTRRHGQLLNNNPAVCEAMTEVKQHVLKHEAYLRTRSDSKFDRDDFDSLSNKFLSKLVIRAN